jgi:hypothetical protein
VWTDPAALLAGPRGLARARPDFPPIRGGWTRPESQRAGSRARGPSPGRARRLAGRDARRRGGRRLAPGGPPGQLDRLLVVDARLSRRPEQHAGAGEERPGRPHARRGRPGLGLGLLPATPPAPGGAGLRDQPPRGLRRAGASPSAPRSPVPAPRLVADDRAELRLGDPGPSRGGRGVRRRPPERARVPVDSRSGPSPRSSRHPRPGGPPGPAGPTAPPVRGATRPRCRPLGERVPGSLSPRAAPAGPPR